MKPEGQVCPSPDVPALVSQRPENIPRFLYRDPETLNYSITHQLSEEGGQTRPSPGVLFLASGLGWLQQNEVVLISWGQP